MKTFRIVYVMYLKAGGGVANWSYQPHENLEDIKAIMKAYEIFQKRMADLEAIDILRIKLVDGEAGSMMMDIHVDQEELMASRLSELKTLIKIQGKDGNWNFDSYNNGLYNGIELSLATLEGREPDYRTMHKSRLKEELKGGENKNEEGQGGTQIQLF